MIKRRTAALIVENLKGEVLLMLRDDKPTISFPNQWGFIGGGIEPGESAEEALIRETKEEISYDIKDYKFFKKCVLGGIEYNVFYIKGDYKLTDFVLNEGQEIQFFPLNKIPKLNAVLNDKKIVLEYLKGHV